MKTALLVCSGVAWKKNIGDYIQSVAARQYSQGFDLYAEREALPDFSPADGAQRKVIMNAWYMSRPENWPPSEYIIPLLTSIHIVPKIAERMLTPEGVKYFKKHEPVGCRDLNTQKILESKGIRTYFSGCLTLTLGKDFKSSDKDGRIFFVDPYFEVFRDAGHRWSNKKAISLALFIIPRFLKLHQLNQITKFEPRQKTTIRTALSRFFQTAAFYKSYSKKFSDDLIFSAQFVTHSVINTDYPSNDQKMELAEEFIRTYAQAKLVITSRIHAALPCLGLETPVIFVNSENLSSQEHSIRSYGRFGGLIELFNVARYTDRGVAYDGVRGKITRETEIQNSSAYLPLAEQMDRKCREFMEDTAE